jgi:hypothetical protein
MLMCVQPSEWLSSKRIATGTGVAYADLVSFLKVFTSVPSIQEVDCGWQLNNWLMHVRVFAFSGFIWVRGVPTSVCCPTR